MINERTNTGSPVFPLSSRVCLQTSISTARLQSRMVLHFGQNISCPACHLSIFRFIVRSMVCLYLQSEDTMPGTLSTPYFHNLGLTNAFDIAITPTITPCNCLAY